MAISVKTKKDLEILREGGRRLAGILQKIAASANPGVSTFDLDKLAENLIFESGGTPSFKGYKIRETRIAYPGSLCVSVNDEVVHSIPRADKILKKGDVVGLDIGMQWPYNKSQIGLYTDMAVTIGIGKISKEADKLIRATRDALDLGIKTVGPGATVGDIGHAVQKYLEKYNFGIIRDLAGHGVGYAVHEEPLIPNYGNRGIGPEFREGMVIAIEPMATLGDWRIKLDDDEWTFRTADGSLSAHFEHTLAVTKNGASILTKI
jgi:methionyl aminopeptidase